MGTLSGLSGCEGAGPFIYLSGDAREGERIMRPQADVKGLAASHGAASTTVRAAREPGKIVKGTLAQGGGEWLDDTLLF